MHVDVRSHFGLPSVELSMNVSLSKSGRMAVIKTLALPCVFSSFFPYYNWALQFETAIKALGSIRFVVDRAIWFFKYEILFVFDY
jgi:hypothetical protein